MTEPSEPIYLQTFSASQLALDFPPQFTNYNKQLVYALACPPHQPPQGTLTVSRWPTHPLPAFFTLSPHLQVEAQAGIFDYQPLNQTASLMEWHLNFAHSKLFRAYGGFMFAQDEIQVAEHPSLASVREALLNSSFAPLTVENGQPTPMLIEGVERRCAIATDPNEEKYRPSGLYGGQFARASEQAIKEAVHLLQPPTISHILAMEAPAYGRGVYTPEQITYILTTAYTGFEAAKKRSAAGGMDKTAIHTGFWGCGAYGGNRVMMLLLQLIAAHLAQINHLVFHLVDNKGVDVWGQVQNVWPDNFLGHQTTVELPELIQKIVNLELVWGSSDGN